MFTNSSRAPAALVVFFVLAACTEIPAYDLPKNQDGKPTVQSIVNRVQCELAKLTEDRGSNSYANRTSLIANDYVVGVSLTLDTTDAGALAPSFSNTFPYNVGSLIGNVGFTLSKSRDQNFTENLYFSMRQLEHSAKRYPNIAKCDGPRDTSLAGDLGLQGAADLAFMSQNLKEDTKLQGTQGVFGGYITFVLTRNINGAGPTWMLTRFKGPTGQLASLSRVNTDKIVYAFAQGPNAGKPDVEPKEGGGDEKAQKALEDVLAKEISDQLSRAGIQQ